MLKIDSLQIKLEHRWPLSRVSVVGTGTFDELEFTLETWYRETDVKEDFSIRMLAQRILIELMSVMSEADADWETLIGGAMEGEILFVDAPVDPIDNMPPLIDFPIAQG